MVSAYLIDAKKMERKKATLWATLAIVVCGLPVALSFGPLSSVKLFMGMDIMDSLDFVTEYLMMPLGAMLTCLFIGWKWKPKLVIDEVEHGGRKFKLAGYYSFLVKTITPLLIGFILYKSSIEAMIKYFFVK